MLNTLLYLNQNLFTQQLERSSMRAGFGSALLELGNTHPNVVALTADLRASVQCDAFRNAFPNRFFDVGVAEQDLVTIASGMAVSGKVPFCVSYAVFSPGRNWEQIRTTVAYNNVNVNIVGSHAGLMTGPDGATHQMTEDIALMRAMPNMDVVTPCDAIEASKATRAIADVNHPAYLRLARPDVAIITTQDTPFSIGVIQAFWVHDNPQATVCACGDMVYYALRAAYELEQQGIWVEVLNISTIKPLDTKTLLTYVKKTNRVVTVEDHQKAGGMGSAVAEFLCENYPVPMILIGVDDAFGESGQPEQLLEKYGLGVHHIKQAVEHIIKIKQPV